MPDSRSLSFNFINAWKRSEFKVLPIDSHFKVVLTKVSKPDAIGHVLIYVIRKVFLRLAVVQQKSKHVF
jgi:hypothetical protein